VSDYLVWQVVVNAGDSILEALDLEPRYQISFRDPELTWLGQQFAQIQTFREWSFGRYGALRQPQPADLANDRLLPDARNLGPILNRLEHTDAAAPN
jgi:hypothetical protein